MCSHCKTKYDSEEFFLLSTKWVDKEKLDLGKVMICKNCDKPFHKGKWQLKEENKDYFISTVCLELEHPGEMFYETMVFSKDDNESIDSRRYKTQEEAEKGHKEFVKRFTKI